jgi:hypothetical protein
MKTLYREILKNDKDDITYIFEAFEEHDSPENHFEDKRDIEFAYSRPSGFFVAKVSAIWKGKIGEDHLGACSYVSFDDFIESGDYIEDMKNEARIQLMIQLEDHRKTEE